MPWYDLNDNLANLGYYLVDTYGLNTDDILYMVEKPWKYNTEWQEYLDFRAEEE